MTIDRYKGQLFCMCDECGTELANKAGKTVRVNGDDFDVLVEKINEAGWKTSKLTPKGGGKPIWEHYCPDCQ